MKKQLITFATACACIGPVFAKETPEPSGAQQRLQPNVVVILADDMRADCIGVLNPRIHTPNIDRLAERGVNKILALKNSNEPGFHKQPCET